MKDHTHRPIACNIPISRTPPAAKINSYLHSIQMLSTLLSGVSYPPGWLTRRELPHSDNLPQMSSRKSGFSYMTMLFSELTTCPWVFIGDLAHGNDLSSSQPQMRSSCVPIIDGGWDIIERFRILLECPYRHYLHLNYQIGLE